MTNAWYYISIFTTIVNKSSDFTTRHRPKSPYWYEWQWPTACTYCWQRHSLPDFLLFWMGQVRKSGTSNNLRPGSVFFSTKSACILTDTPKWGYQGPQGPDKWPAIEERCGGDKQSPINIYTHQVVYDKTLGNLRLGNYDKTPPSGWMIKNNGHTATITGAFANESTRPFMFDGSLPSDYDFLNMHFHWGKDENPGSEHLFNYKRYPAEASHRIRTCFQHVTCITYSRSKPGIQQFIRHTFSSTLCTCDAILQSTAATIGKKRALA